MYKLINFITKKDVKCDNFVFTGKNSPWEVVMDMKSIRNKINLDYFMSAPPCLSKYLPFMPIKEPAKFISLREFATPLIKSKVLSKRFGIDLYFKVEGKNPTGSFKDRGSAVDITVAKELGAKGLVVASTGNMAASCSGYAAAANMDCFIFVPEGVPRSKLAQVISYGGHIVQVKGSYNDAAKLAYNIALDRNFYLAGDYAFRVEGQKTAAFEIIDQLLFQVPDFVIVPIGCGTNISAYAKGFDDYIKLNLIDKKPKLVGVQAKGANAVVNSYNLKSNKIKPIDACDTIASAICVNDPLDGVKALSAIYDSNGLAIDVSDKEIMEAQYTLATEEGLFVESSSASTIASLKKLIQNDKSICGKKIICVLTGEGLKDPNVILKSAIKPPTIFPNIAEFSKLYDRNFFKNKNLFFIEKNKIIFKDPPNKEEIKTTLKSLFENNYSDLYIEEINKIILNFLKKGKTITLSDLQDIVQDAREYTKYNKKSLSVFDFNVETGKDKVPYAKVIVNIDDKKYEANSHGVGPVDAVIKALSKACKKKLEFKLTDYKVDIRNQGVDTVVSVELKLFKDNFNSIGRSSSPDIIQASIEAFEKAYNGL